jgi:hypothetical protein
MPADLDSLRTDFPHWFFTATWVTVSGAPRERTILAKRRSDGILVGGPSEQEVRRKIASEDEFLLMPRHFGPA